MHCEESDGHNADLPAYPHPGSRYIHQSSLAFHRSNDSALFLKLSSTFWTFPYRDFLTVSFLKNDFNNITKALANLLTYLF